MNVKELYLDCLRFEEYSLVHYIHHLLAEQKISLDDNISKLDLNQADYQKVAMNHNDFVYIFAGSQQEAIQFYIKTFHLSRDFELTRGNGVISFRDMRKEFMNFLAIEVYFKR